MKILAIGNFSSQDISDLLTTHEDAETIHFFCCNALLKSQHSIQHHYNNNSVANTNSQSIHNNNDISASIDIDADGAITTLLSEHSDATITYSKHMYISIYDSLSINDIIDSLQPNKVIFGGNSFQKLPPKSLGEVKHDLYRAFLCILPMIHNIKISLTGDFIMPEIIKDQSLDRSQWSISA